MNEKEKDVNNNDVFADDIITVQDVANICDVSPNTVYFWIKSKKIKAKKYGRQWLVEKENLQKFLLENENTIKAIARKMNIAENTLRKQVRSGKVSAYKRDGKWIVLESSPDKV